MQCGSSVGFNFLICKMGLLVSCPAFSPDEKRFRKADYVPVWAQVHLQSILKGQVLFICVPLLLRVP